MGETMTEQPQKPNLYEALKVVMRLFGAAIAVLYVLRGGRK